MRRAVPPLRYRVDFVAGYRFARLDDKLLLTEDLVPEHDRRSAAGTNFKSSTPSTPATSSTAANSAW